MPQAIWTGTLGFGLVSIPVRLYPATQPKDVRFHLYDRTSGRRVRRSLVTREEEPPVFMPEEPRSRGGLAALGPGAPRPVERGPVASDDVDGIDEDDEDMDDDEDDADLPAMTAPEREVASSDIVRGYTLPSGDLVTVEEEELASLRPERSRNIEIEEFVDLAEIDPVFFEKSYYLAPGRGQAAEKPYALLVRAMRSAGMVAIGRFVLRTRPHLVAVRPLENILALETLYFGDEVRTPEELVRGGAAVSEREVETAKQLIAALQTDWVPEKHGDAYREELLELLSGKAPAVAAPEEEPRTAPVDDLMAQLKASVEAAKKRGDMMSKTRGRGQRSRAAR